jgi:hypothetical protein
MQSIIVSLNLVLSLVTAAGGALALFRPTTLLGATRADPGGSYYVRLYSARAIPIGIAAAILPFLLRRPGAASFLFVAAAIQAGDAFAGALRSNVKMAVAASITAVVHIACGATLF